MAWDILFTPLAFLFRRLLASLKEPAGLQRTHSILWGGCRVITTFIPFAGMKAQNGTKDVFAVSLLVF
jgi:hypothetical protein